MTLTRRKLGWTVGGIGTRESLAVPPKPPRKPSVADLMLLLLLLLKFSFLLLFSLLLLLLLLLGGRGVEFLGLMGRLGLRLLLLIHNTCSIFQLLNPV